MKAVVMAGGLGSRLQPLTIGCPKPMVHFIDKPVLGHILTLLKHHHITEIIITACHMADQIRDYLGDGRHLGVTIHYVIEETPLGTAGGVKNAERYLDDQPFLVISGDAITDIDLSSVLQFHQRKGALATLALKQVPDPHEYGVVIIAGDGRVTEFFEKPSPDVVVSQTVNTGIYVLEPEVLALMEPDQRYDFSYDIFPRLLRADALYGHLSNGYWRDIGTVPTYIRAMADALSGKISLIKSEQTGGSGTAVNHYLGHHSLKEQSGMSILKNRKIFPLYWGLLALVMLAGDFFMGPYIQFPFLFIIPVTLAAWTSGLAWGFFLAIILPLVRLYFVLLWPVSWTVFDSGINALIRVMVLLLLAFLVDRVALQTRTLTAEVHVLRGLLPICSYCKKIRNEASIWERIEGYISRHSEAEFSHGVCPDCAREHFGEYLQD